MIHLKYIRYELDKLKKSLRRRGITNIDLEKLVKLDKKSSDISIEIGKLSEQRNKATKVKDKIKGSQLKARISKLCEKNRPIHNELFDIQESIPNIVADDVPNGGEENNKVIGKVGKTPILKNPKDHIQLGKDLDIIDVERGVKTSGSRFYFLKNQAVELEFALIQWVMALLKKEKFELLITPQLVKREVMRVGGYMGQAEDEIYKTQDDLYLIGTSEQSMLGYHMDEIITVPKRYVAFSTCFRREAGSYGKDVKGIIRTHQFDKVEMFSFVEPKDSAKEHERLVKLEEKILKELGIPYQKVLVAAGDLGMSAAKKIDLESWIPSQNRYRETHSCSNCTDYQAGGANIRFKNKAGKNEIVHTLNGTAIAIGRLLVALLENYQQPNGSVKIPKVLHKYLSFKEINNLSR